MKLGELINKLKTLEQEAEIRIEAGDLIVYPQGFDSYRGYNSELAIGFSGDYGTEIIVKDFLKYCELAVDKSFTGWKGGDFLMTRKTLVHIDNFGNVSNIVINNIVPKLDEFGSLYYLIKTKAEK